MYLIRMATLYHHPYILMAIIISIVEIVDAQNFRIRLCVPDSSYEDCLQMSDNIPGTFSCINARDKFECMSLIDKDEADIANLDAEDLYLGGRLYDLEPFAMEEYNGNVYLERSAVIVPRRSRISSIHELKGKRACLGPYNHIHKWNVPIGILLASETMVPDCRGELQTVANYFGDSCAAGNWSTDNELDEELKRTVPRLCSLCKDSSFLPCSENDMFGGVDGSIKCLVEGGRGEVAFTTIETAIDYFNRRPEERDHYELLCLDGSRMAVTTRGCDWAKHPTNTFVIRKSRERNKEIYLRILQQVFSHYFKLRPSWFDKSFVSSSNITQLVHMPVQQSRWSKYLEFYIPSIEKPLQGCTRRNITFCLSREGEMTKCQQLQKASFARRIRPSIRCYQADSDQTCIKLLNERRADLMILQPDKFYHAARYQSLQPLAVEQSNKPKYGVAVVRSSSDLTMFGQLRGKRSCHTGFGDLSGWLVPIGALIQDQIVDPAGCNRAHVILDYFSGSCVPGAADARINPNGTGVEQLCQQCVGDDQGRHICDLQSGERYSGEEGALRCLVEGRGDVAFLSHQTIVRYTDGRSPVSWANELKSSDFRLLCRSTNPQSTMGRIQFTASDDILGSRHSPLTGRTMTQALITDYHRCNIARIPDPVIATSIYTPLDVRLDALLLLNQLSESFLYHNKNSFRLAGTFRNRSDLIFSDHTERIRSVRADTSLREALGDFLPILQDNDPIACGSDRFYQSTTFVNLMISTIFVHLILNVVFV